MRQATGSADEPGVLLQGPALRFWTTSTPPNFSPFSNLHPTSTLASMFLFSGTRCSGMLETTIPGLAGQPVVKMTASKGVLSWAETGPTFPTKNSFHTHFHVRFSYQETKPGQSLCFTHTLMVPPGQRARYWPPRHRQWYNNQRGQRHRGCWTLSCHPVNNHHHHHSPNPLLPPGLSPLAPNRSTFHSRNHYGNRSPEKQHPQHSRRQDRL